MTTPTIDYNVYQPPGTSIVQQDTPLTTPTGVPQPVVALIGVSSGYRTNTDQVDLGSDAVILSQLGIAANSVVVTDASTGNVIASNQYQLSILSGEVLQGQNYHTQIVLANGATITDPTSVQVSYQYQTPDYFAAKTFNNYDDLKAAYGEPLNLLPQAAGDTAYKPIASPISLAAKLCFGAGASIITVVPIAGPASNANAATASSQVRTQIAAAYSQIGTDYSISFVVPLFDGVIAADAVGAAQELKAHVDAESRDGYFRQGLVGFDAPVATTPDTLTAAVRDSRVWVPYGQAGGNAYYNGAINQTLALGQQYLAAAIAGLAASLSSQIPLTEKQVVGFSGLLGSRLSLTTRNLYSSKGVMVIEPDPSGSLVIRHGVTSDPTSSYTSEVSLVRGRDTMVSVLRSGLKASGLIGSPITAVTLYSIKASVATVLEALTGSNVIQGYNNLGVRQLSSNPSVIQVQFAYLPTYPLNYIQVVFSVDTTTGQTTLTDVTQAPTVPTS